MSNLLVGTGTSDFVGLVSVEPPVLIGNVLIVPFGEPVSVGAVFPISLLLLTSSVGSYLTIVGFIKSFLELIISGFFFSIGTTTFFGSSIFL